MPKFEKGDIVIIARSGIKGTVIEVLPFMRGQQPYKVFADGTLSTYPEVALLENTNLEDPFEKVRRSIYGTCEQFSQINTSFKIQNTSNSTISTLKSSKTLFHPYQFKPLLKFLNSTKRRILVADEVGLGKTIEAGHIMLELKARNEFKHALVVCPKALTEKWETELLDKFNFSFKVYDRITDLAVDLEKMPQVYGIINYEKLRISTKGIREKNVEGEEQILSFAQWIERHGGTLDFILCDEAHRLRNSSTKTYKGLEKIINTSKAAVFLTATPIMISQENLYNLLHLLDSVAYSNYGVFLNALSMNQPFIEALGALNAGAPLPEIATHLENATITTFSQVGQTQNEKRKTIRERFSDIPFYIDIIKRLKTQEDNEQNRIALQDDITSLSKMNNIFSRTRKREVTKDWTQAERYPQTLTIDLYPEERELFDEIIEQYEDEVEYISEFDDSRRKSGANLGLITRKRQVSSSVYAFANRESDLESGFDAFANKPDAKIDKLLEIIQEVVGVHHKKLIVFALFHKTLQYLTIRLEKAGIKTSFIHGGVDVEERNKILETFRNGNSINVLLSSEVGSEGLDMQFCDAMVNYDLPWNPMVVEQRIGRIDRFGQKSEKVNIYTMVVADSIQEDIYTRLLDRIGIFRSSIGDLEAIMDKELDKSYGHQDYRNLREYFASLEKELYSTKLTKEEREAKLQDIEKAIEVEKENAEKISEGMTNALTNDISFQNEISKILKHKQYVTDEELVNYVNLLIRKSLPTCMLQLKDKDKSIYTFHVPQKDANALSNFLVMYCPLDESMASENRSFVSKIKGETKFDVTFNQETAFNNKNLFFINAYHPIILAAQKYFATVSSDNTFLFSLRKQQAGVPEGTYFLAVYISAINHRTYGQNRIISKLIPVLYDVNGARIIEDEDIAMNLLGEAQLHAEPTSEMFDIDTLDVNLLDLSLKQAALDIEERDFEYQQRKVESLKTLDIQRAEEYHSTRISNQEGVIRESEFIIEHPYYYDDDVVKGRMSIIRTQRSNLESYKLDRDKEIEQLNETGISREGELKLLTLSQINVN